MGWAKTPEAESTEHNAETEQKWWYNSRCTY